MSPCFDPTTADEAEHLRWAPWQAPNSSYLGQHRRSEPDANGWPSFDVYAVADLFAWSACTANGSHRGHRFGPFKSARRAYYAAEEFREEDE